jgi:hypothetical protein
LRPKSTLRPKRAPAIASQRAEPAQTNNPQNFLVDLADQQIFLVKKMPILHLFPAPFVPVSVRF